MHVAGRTPVTPVEVRAFDGKGGTKWSVKPTTISSAQEVQAKGEVASYKTLYLC